eukprot:TRINITY_DN16684_c0_g1_i1.p1 TRINITY_DN16684_c0_g1~~TRINITY_DN16684_c0_g1_i1.p1  ORF type:complete len:382 (+),score=91.20 TRINITY_DN16684_c0_g1_i1:430-1575(+)
MKASQSSVSRPVEEEKNEPVEEVQVSSQPTQDNKENKLWEAHSEAEAPTTESSSDPISRSDNKKVSCEDIQLVQNLIERCLQLYMDRGEVVNILLSRARIEPGFTSLVWQKLEEQNSDFFKAYYTRLKLKNQIIVFNRLLEQQCQLMRMQVPANDSLTPLQNGIPSVHHPPMGYPVFQQSHLPASGHPHSHMVPLSCRIPGQTVVNGIPAHGSFLPVSMNSSLDNVADSFMEGNHLMQNPNNVVSSAAEIPGNLDSNTPTSFPFHSTDMSGVGANLIPLDLPFLAGDAGLNGSCTLQSTSDDSGKDSLRLSSQPLQNFSLLDLSADLSNGGLGTLGSYSGSPFLSQDADGFLESPENDEIDEDFFIDSVTEPCKSEEDKVG